MNVASRIPAVLIACSLGLTALFGTSGCVALIAGAGAAGAVAYVRGELAGTLNADLARAQNATEKAITQLGLAKVSDRRDALEALFIARTATDKKVELKLEKLGDNMARIRIRVDLFGDEAMSLAILEKVKANL